MSCLGYFTKRPRAEIIADYLTPEQRVIAAGLLTPAQVAEINKHTRQQRFGSAGSGEFSREGHHDPVLRAPSQPAPRHYFQ
jgi:hypothetical protein